MVHLHWFALETVQDKNVIHKSAIINEH